MAENCEAGILEIDSNVEAILVATKLVDLVTERIDERRNSVVTLAGSQWAPPPFCSKRYLMLSLQSLHEEWETHRFGKNRARGGRVALSGFLFQIFLSLDRFFGQVLDGRRDAQFAFEGLSDLAELEGNIVYLTQVKISLDARALRSAVDEALAVVRFLDETHPELLDYVRFQVAVRRSRSSTIVDIAALDAEKLGLDGDDRQLWASIRTRFLPVQVRANPKTDLAIRLWPHARECFTLVDTCVGRLFTLLGENHSCDVISESLLEVWDKARAARAEDRPPCHLFGPRELAPITVSRTEIVQGARPRPSDLRAGCFMDRPQLLRKALETMRAMSLQIEAKENRQVIPVFWIAGPSGAGKSVLLLQAMQELLVQGDVQSVNYLGEFVHTLPRALSHWSAATERALIVVDDLFVAENREPRLWQEIAEVAFSATWCKVPWILTCGPTEQLKEFNKEVHRHAEFRTVEIHVKPLSSDEQSAYHAWYQQRTGFEVPIANEPIFVAATWIYELRRHGDLSPQAFADRFQARLKELGLTEAAFAALALTQYRLRVPHSLFNGHESAIDQLTSEAIYRLAHRRRDVRDGRFFHPRIAKIIYDALGLDTVSQAKDLARGFSAMLDEGDGADQFARWLNKPKTQSILSPSLMREVIVAMWQIVSERGLTENVVPVLKSWHELAHSGGVDLNPIGALFQIRKWFDECPQDARPWGLLFQMVWDDATHDQRDALFVLGYEWMVRFHEPMSWSWIWQKLWSHRPQSNELVSLAFLWSYKNPAHIGWNWVWQCIFNSGVREPDLLGCALMAIPVQPEGPADVHIWNKVETLQPNKTDFLAAIVHKLCNVRSPLKRVLGIEFVFARTDAASLCKTLSAAIALPMWPQLWEGLVERYSRDRRVVKLGFDWLAGREDKPEWAFVWQSLVETCFEKGEVLPVGRNWLAGREDKPEWSYIWRRLAALGFEKDELLPMGREWLLGREDRPEWAFVWQSLVMSGFERKDVLRIGRNWLAGREDKPEWTFVWQKLNELRFDKVEILSIGHDWLAGREDKPEWGFVWEILVKSGFERKVVVAIGQDWLAGREDERGWTHVWRYLVGLGFAKHELLPIGYAWLAGREDKPEWSQVWKILIEVDFEKHELLLIGYAWLLGREDKPEWSHVWQKLVHVGFKKGELLPMGREWLAGREDKREWAHVWQTLVKAGFDNDALLPIGRDWLVGREDTPEWNYVWQVLVKVGFESENVFHIGWDWLIGREMKREWTFVWQSLVKAGFDNDALLPIGRDWLVGSEDTPEWNYVWQTLIGVDFGKDKLLPVGRDWLIGREKKLDWPFVWQTLVKAGFDNDALLPIGRDWLAGKEDHPEWNHVWQTLIVVGFEKDKLLPVGRDWLAGRENKPAWSHVWRRLLAEGFEKDRLLPVGRDWLVGREKKRGWIFVWQSLVKAGIDSDQVLAIGRDWLARHKDHDEYHRVYRVLNSSAQGNDD